MKEQVDKDCECLKKNGPFFANSKNWIVLRYADVMLMRAEAEVELAALGDAEGNLEEARSLVNDLRRRAAASNTMIFDYDAKMKVTPTARHGTWSRHVPRCAGNAALKPPWSADASLTWCAGAWPTR